MEKENRSKKYAWARLIKKMGSGNSRESLFPYFQCVVPI